MKKFYWIIGLIFCLSIGIQVNAEEKLPYMSEEYLEKYIKENDIDVYNFKGHSKVVKMVLEYIQKGDSKLVKEDSELFGQPYYALTNEWEAEFLYMGKMKKNKPDGIGAIFVPVELVMDDVETGKAHITKITDYSDTEGVDVYLSVVYMGEFKDGRPDGYGIEYSSPADDNYMEQPIDTKMYGSDDIQTGIYESANPIRYEGGFKEGKYSGKGNEYIYMGIHWEEEGMEAEDYSELYGDNEEKNSKIEAFFGEKNEDILICSGNYKKGKMDGDFKIYQFGYLSYEGDMKKDERTGKGKVYYPFSNQLQYEGELTMGECDGKGTMYNEDGSVLYKGEWEMGDYAH